MTSSWDVADWYSAMLDLGNYYEEELQELSVQTVGQLVSYPIGCILAMILFWLLWGRLGLLPPVGTRELSQLAWFALTLFSCSIGPLVELVGYARPSFSDGFLAGYCPGVFYCAATAVKAVPAARIAVTIATAVTIIRIVLYAVRELSDDAGGLLSGAVFGIRARLLDLAIALHFVLIALLVVTSLTAKVFPTADRTTARGEEAGDLSMAPRLAKAYRDGANDLEQDEGKALQCLVAASDYEAAHQGEPEVHGQFHVLAANWLFDGRGCEPGDESAAKALALLRRATSFGWNPALNNLGWALKEGRGCATDYKEAAAMFKRAIRAGSSRSWYHLGTMLEEGMGTAPNIEHAILCYSRAAAKGDTEAKDRLRILGVLKS